MIHILALVLFSVSVFAAPREIEVWFISNHKVAELQKYLDRPQYIYRPQTAELACQEMGDYCFDPQFGLYKRDLVQVDDVEKADAGKVVTEGPSIPPAKTIERELIDCDPKNYFDIFCGKAQKQAQGKSKLDLWVDTSSSMREFDYMEKDGSCNRKSLVQSLDKSCGFGKNLNVMMFDTSIKQAGAMDSLCNNQGLNEYKKLIDWIERSDAPKLVVITDIYEFHKEFSDYIESKHGKLRGDKEPLTAKQMLDLADSLAKSCR